MTLAAAAGLEALLTDASWFSAAAWPLPEPTVKMPGAEGATVTAPVATFLPW